MLHNLNDLDGKEFKIDLRTDENGMLGRECPNTDCKGYFKVKPGTGVTDSEFNPRCPYCGEQADSQVFSTNEQIEYAKSIVMRKIQNAIESDLNNWGRQLERKTRGGFIRIKAEYKSHSLPIYYYEEKELETTVTCENCGLVYSIFGKFAFCPDCGVDNTIQILRKNLELIHKVLVLAEAETDESYKDYLVSNALEDIVSTLDSFGRNCVRLFTKTTRNSEFNISFQNISKAHEIIQKEFEFDFLDDIEPEHWEQIIRNFQKRHIISHNDGIIDDVYLQITKDPNASFGRKVSISIAEIESLLVSIEIIANNLQKGLADWKSREGR